MEPQNNVSESPNVKTKGYITADGVTTVYPPKIFGIIAVIGVVVMTIAVVITLLTRTDQSSAVYAIVLIAALGTPLFLISFVQRYYIDSEKIVCRNMLGIKKKLCWSEIKTVRINPCNHTDIKLYGTHTVIKIYPAQYFGSRSIYIKDVIRKHCSDAEWKYR